MITRFWNLRRGWIFFFGRSRKPMMRTGVFMYRPFVEPGTPQVNCRFIAPWALVTVRPKKVFEAVRAETIPFRGRMTVSVGDAGNELPAIMPRCDARDLNNDNNRTGPSA